MASFPQVPPRWFSPALLLTALLVSIPLFILGRSEFIGYDGFLHIFISNVGNWRAFWLELKADAHPPIFYLLLHYVLKLGHNLLIYRLPVIVPGIATVWAIGKITAKLTGRPVFGLLAAATYGLSASMIEINIDVRSYALALLFVTLAFDHLIDFVTDPAGRYKRFSCVWFSVCTGLAIATEYYSIFFYAACLFLIAALALRYPPFRSPLLEGIGSHRVMRALAVSMPAIEFAIFYFVHASRQVLDDSDFRWNTAVHKTIREFVSANLVREWNYLLPIHATSPGVVATLVGGALIVVVYAAFFRNFSFRSAAASAPGLILFALLFELIVLAIAQKYPFGGELRQQSILAPFIVLTAFSALDSLLNRFGRWANVGVCLVAVFIGVHFYSTWKTYPRYTVHDYVGPNADAFPVAIPHPRAIFTDQFSLIWYFMYTHQSQWTFVRRLGNSGYVYGFRVQEFSIRDASGNEIPLLRTFGLWNFDLEHMDFYRLLADSLRAARIGTVDLFHVTETPKTRDAAALKKFEEQIVRQAAAVGLDVTRRSIDNNHVFAEFALKDQE